MAEETLEQFLKKKFKGSWKISKILRKGGKEQRELNKKYEKLTLQEKESYMNIMDKFWDGSWNIKEILHLFFFPIYFLFYLGVFSIVLKFGFGVDLSPLFLSLFGIIGNFWYFNGVILILVVMFFLSFSQIFQNKKRKKELLNGKRRN